jgi:hypothetical protein
LAIGNTIGNTITNAFNFANSNTQMMGTGGFGNSFLNTNNQQVSGMPNNSFMNNNVSNNSNNNNQISFLNQSFAANSTANMGNANCQGSGYQNVSSAIFGGGNSHNIFHSNGNNWTNQANINQNNHNIQQQQQLINTSFGGNNPFYQSFPNNMNNNLSLNNLELNNMALQLTSNLPSQQIFP